MVCALRVPSASMCHRPRSVLTGDSDNRCPVVITQHGDMTTSPRRDRSKHGNLSKCRPYIACTESPDHASSLRLFLGKVWDEHEASPPSTATPSMNWRRAGSRYGVCLSLFILCPKAESNVSPGVSVSVSGRKWTVHRHVRPAGARSGHRDSVSRSPAPPAVAPSSIGRPRPVRATAPGCVCGPGSDGDPARHGCIIIIAARGRRRRRRRRGWLHKERRACVSI